MLMMRFLFMNGSGNSVAYQVMAATIRKLGRTVCVYSMVQRREKEKDSRYMQEALAPAAAPCIRPVTCLRHIYTSNNSK